MPPTPPIPRTRRRRALVAMLAGVPLALVLAIALAWALDGLWLKPAIQRYVMSHAGRSFEFSEIHVRVDRALDPSVEFRDLAVQNAPWADPRPLIVARRLKATFAWRTLLGGDMTVVRLLELEGAEVDLERQADGLRNWRLGQPDDRGPPRVRVQALDARESRLHTVHRGIDLRALASIAPLPAPRPVAGRPDLPLTKRLAFEGTYQGHAFAGSAAVSELLTFGESGARFAFDGEGRTEGLHLEARGLATDAHQMDDSEFDARVASEGERGSLWPLPLREAFARVRPFAATAHVTKSGGRWAATGLQAELGHRTRLAGELHVLDDRDAGRRRRVDASLREPRLDLADLRAFTGQAPDAARPASAPAPARKEASPDQLRTLDASLDVHDARFADSDRGLVQSLSMRARLERGVLRLESLDLGLAGGHLEGSATLDASGPEASLALALQARGLRLERLSDKLAASGGVEGRLDGRAALRAQGATREALARSAAGTIEAALAPGASVTRRVDAKLGLNGDEWLRTLFDHDERVPVACAALTLEVAGGVGTSRRLVFETERTALAGRGTLDFAAGTLDATLMPVRKERALFALDRSLHASGPWHAVKVALGPPLADAKPQRCP